MKLTVRGYAPIVIPTELLQPMRGAFGQETPYVAKIAARWKSKAYLTKKLPLKLKCLEAVRDCAAAFPGGYQSYSEPMAGIGISARIFGTGRQVFLNDLDESCRRVLAANFKTPITSQDVFKGPLQKADMVFLDFNDFTFKRFVGKYSPVVEAAALAAQKFVVINDCSPFYLRYGPSSFAVYSKLVGCKVTTVPEYLAALRPHYKAALGLHLVFASYFSETSFLLLSTRPAPLTCFSPPIPDAGFVVADDDTPRLY